MPAWTSCSRQPRRRGRLLVNVWRKFFDVHGVNGSPIAKEGLERIGKLYAVEKEINGLVPDQR